MQYMLDTSTCIFIMKKKSKRVLENLQCHMKDGISISTITLAELEYGVFASDFVEKNMFALNQFLSRIHILDFDDNAAIEFGKIFADLRRKGTPIGPIDTLIAAHAISSNQTLVTNNIREFERVNGLSYVDWMVE